MRNKILLLFHKVNDSGPSKPTQMTELASHGEENGQNIVEARMHENVGASIALNYLNIKYIYIYIFNNTLSRLLMFQFLY